MNRRDAIHLCTATVALVFTASAFGFDRQATATVAGANRTELRVTATDVAFTVVTGNVGDQITLQGEGILTEPGRPALPAVTRYFVIPAGSTPRVTVSSLRSHTVTADRPPATFDHSSGGLAALSAADIPELYPPTLFRVRRPVVMRGVTLLPVTTYPVQYGSSRAEYTLHDEIAIAVETDPGTPIHLAMPPLSRDLGRLLDDVVVGLPHRDDPPADAPAGRYVVVSREECLEYAIPLLEWKRQAGYEVQVIVVTAEEAADEGAAGNIKANIQALYDEARRQGREPFEYILLIGDRVANQGGAPWTLPSFLGLPTMEQTEPHADYVFGLLEGDDDVADAAVGRITAGSRERMELAVARQLAYERSPYMDDTSWFRRGGVFSQHWGIDWQLHLPYAVRWGEMLLVERGFGPILRYESFEQDDGGADIGPELARWLNQGLNLMVGRAQNRYWERGLQGVNDNVVFPFGINTCGHGEFIAEWMFSTGDRDHLKGPVVWTTGWGTPVTLFSNGVWLTLVRGVVVKDLPIGWARAELGLTLPQVFPGERDVSRTYQSDLDLYGDPGLKPWMAAPRRVRVLYNGARGVGVDLVTAQVVDAADGEPVTDARLTLYFPGQLPDPAEYPDWQPPLHITSLSDPDGRAAFSVPEGLSSGRHYLTATGRNILPTMELIDIGAAQEPLLVVEEIELLGDAAPIAGTQFLARVFVRNRGWDVQGLQGSAASHSPYVTVSDDVLHFGEVASGQLGAGDEPVTIILRADCPDSLRPFIQFTLSDGERQWESALRIQAEAPLLTVGGGGGEFPLDQVFSLRPELANNGSASWEGGSVRMISRDWRIEIPDTIAVYGELHRGEARDPNGDDEFRLRARPGALPGSDVRLALIAGSRAGVVDTVEFPIALAAPRGGRPEPPDDYGYTCLDNNDTLWSGALRYEWIEISPFGDNPDAEGDSIRFPAVDGSTAVIGLPFPLRFYGREYDSITVCTNGFISVGSQGRQVNYQNTPLNLAAGGASGMIAPFWDHLSLSDPTWAGVLTYYDTLNARFIIEWFSVHPVTDLRILLNFQVVIRDAAQTPTASGDSPIQFNYEDITHVAGENVDIPFASVGLSSPDGKTGIGVNYHSSGTEATPLVANGTSLLFTTVPQSRQFGKGAVSGGITQADNGAPIADQPISLNAYGLGSVWRDTTNRDGLFRLTAVTPGTYQLEVRRRGFNPWRRIVAVVARQAVALRIELTHPEIALDREALVDSLRPGHIARRYVRIYNSGDGPLRFEVSVTDAEGRRPSWCFVNQNFGELAPAADALLIVALQTAGLPDGDYSATIRFTDAEAYVTTDLPVRMNVDPANRVQDDDLFQPLRWELKGNYPNPFNGVTRIEFSTAAPGYVRLSLFDTGGRLVGRVFDGMLPAGRHSLAQDAAGLPPGLYILRMEAGPFTSSRKTVLLK